MLECAIKDKLVGNVNIPYFGRQTKIKWWYGINLADHGKDRISRWFADNPTFCNKCTDQTQFLMAKSQNQARIAAASTPDEIFKIAEEIKKTMANMSQVDTDSDNQDKIEEKRRQL
ncbi:hypothetical protein Ddye_028212 [Dipteronia dyeriana]|uniref:Uncharacterized protein n=1 Tax=Dipteronia dyeriana TaxID=168575 RepID=A0AAD9TQL1_9ROSI|nr:hypothetical protein Ddye_028212 [Dipteronia dyeriana]